MMQIKYRLMVQCVETILFTEHRELTAGELAVAVRDMSQRYCDYTALTRLLKKLSNQGRIRTVRLRATDNGGKQAVWGAVPPRVLHASQGVAGG